MSPNMDNLIAIPNEGKGHCLILALLSAAGVLCRWTKTTFTGTALAMSIRQSLATQAKSLSLVNDLLGKNGDSFLERDAVVLFASLMQCGVNIRIDNYYDAQAGPVVDTVVDPKVVSKKAIPYLWIRYDANHYEGLLPNPRVLPTIVVTSNDWTSFRAKGNFMAFLCCWIKYLTSTHAKDNVKEWPSVSSLVSTLPAHFQGWEDPNWANHGISEETEQQTLSPILTHGPGIESSFNPHDTDPTPIR